MPCRRVRNVAPLLALLLAQAPATWASVSLTDADVAAASAAAVHGVVTSVTPVHDTGVGAIYTVVSLRLIQSWGLAATPATLDLKLLGGTLGSRTLRVDGQAAFVPGQEVFAFLEVRPRDRTFAVTALGRGTWTIDRYTALALRTLQEHGAGADAHETRTLAELRALATLTGTRVRVPAVVRPHLDPPPRSPDLASGPLAAAIGRWHRADWRGPVTIDAAGLAGLPASTSAVTALLAAAATWSAPSALSLAPGGLTAPRCFADAAGDGRIVVTFGDPCDEIPDTSPVLAFGAAFFDTADTRVVNGVPYAAITSGLVVVDDAAGKIDRLGAVCLQELVTHEIGHTLGLGHTSDVDSVMYPTLSPTCETRGAAMPLSTADRATLHSRYPAATETGPPNSPVGLLAAVNGTEVRLRWSAAAGSEATAYRVLAGSAPGESDLGAIAVQATGLDVSGVARGVYYLRIVAVNAAGASAPSAEITVVVGPDVPGAPTGLMGAADSAGRVRLYWQRPAGSASVTGYVLLVRAPADGRLLRVPVGATSLSAEGVAPGAYPVRVAAVTAAGLGPASAEVLVLVP